MGHTAGLEVRLAGLDLGWIATGGQLPEVPAGHGGLGPEPPPERGTLQEPTGAAPLFPVTPEDRCGQLLVAFACD